MPSSCLQGLGRGECPCASVSALARDSYPRKRWYVGRCCGRFRDLRIGGREALCEVDQARQDRITALMRVMNSGTNQARRKKLIVIR